MNTFVTQKKCEGMSTLGTLVLVSLASVVAWALVSAPFRTKVETRFEELTTWTPAQIQRDPGTYLIWAKQALGEIQDLLAARRLELLKSRELTATQLKSVVSDIPRTGMLLDEAKATYKQDGWPANLRGRDLSKEEGGELILLLSDQLDLLETQRTALVHRLETLDQGLSTLGVKSFQADGLLVQIESAKVRQMSVSRETSSQDISTKLADLGATVSALHALGSNSVVGDMRSLHHAHEREERLEQILSE